MTIYCGYCGEPHGGDCPNAPAEADGPRTFSLDTVAALIRDAGFPATVEQTGGGCATLYAGRRGEAENGNESADVIVGPGWFTSGGFGGGAGAMFVRPGEPMPPSAPFSGAMADDVECCVADRDGDVLLYAADVAPENRHPDDMAEVVARVAMSALIRADIVRGS